MDRDRLARSQADVEGALGVGLPDPVGRGRDEAAAPAALRTSALDALVAGVRLEAALEGGAGDLDPARAELGAEHRQQEGQRLLGVLLEVAQGRGDDLGRQAAAGLALVLAGLRPQAAQPPAW